MTTIRRAPGRRRAYAVQAAPYANTFGRTEAELSFPARDKRRALEHRAAAVELTALYGVEWRTPWSLAPGWTLYRELSEGARFGQQDERRMIVSGPERSVARFLAALPRVLAELEAAATRAARTFARWRRSLLAVMSGHLDYEDPGTLRVRAREFRTAVLGHLVSYLRTPPAPTTADPARPLWNQAAAIAAEVWAERPVDPWEVTEEEVAAVLARVVRPGEPAVVEQVTAAPAVEDDQDHEPEDQAAAVHQLAHDEHQADEETAAAAVEEPAGTVAVRREPGPAAGTVRFGLRRRWQRAPVRGPGRRQLAGRPSPVRQHRRPRPGPPAPPVARTAPMTRKAARP